jgi:hypothetical protein
LDYKEFYSSFQNALAPQILSILAALAILIVGWLIAVVLRAASRRGLGALGLNRRLESALGRKVSLENGIAVGLFWFVIVLTLIGVFNALSLPMISESLQGMVDQVLGYLPRLLAALVLGLVAWAVASLARTLVNRALGATQLDEQLSQQAGMAPMSHNVAGTLFWLVLLMFLPAIVGALGLDGILRPLQEMMDNLLAALPNIFAAVVIGLVGWLVAGILRGLTTSALDAAGIEKLGARAGLSNNIRLASVLGTVVFIVVFFPALIAAFEALKIDAIAGPATDMLRQFMAAVPSIVAAVLILVVTFLVARVVADLVTKLTEAGGIDRLPAAMGLRELPATDRLRPSVISGRLVLFFAMLFAGIEAANRLGLSQVADAGRTFVWFAGDVLLGGLILVVGFWLAGLAYSAIRQTSSEFSGLLAEVARVAIIALVLAMGLRAMGIADDIVNLGFALTFGAVAVAIALAFGLGGREAAGRQLEHWFSKLRRDEAGPHDR